MKISGKKIKTIREEKGMSRAELSRLSAIPARTIQDWELGNRNPRNFDTIEAIARSLNVEISDLYDDEYLSILNVQALNNAERYADSEQGEAELVECIEQIYEAQGLTGILKLLDRFIFEAGIEKSLEIIEEFNNESC